MTRETTAALFVRLHREAKLKEAELILSLNATYEDGRGETHSDGDHEGKAWCLGDGSWVIQVQDPVKLSATYHEADGDVIRTIDQYTESEDERRTISCPECATPSDAHLPCGEDTPDPLFPAVITSCPSCGHYE